MINSTRLYQAWISKAVSTRWCLALCYVGTALLSNYHGQKYKHLAKAVFIMLRHVFSSMPSNSCIQHPHQNVSIHLRHGKVVFHFNAALVLV